jgi:hypothetical protein
MDPRSRGINDDGTHRLLPATMQEDQLKEVTLDLDTLLAEAVGSALLTTNAKVAVALADILFEHGLAMVRRATLERIIPGYDEMWQAAQGELVALLGEGGALPEILFHNEGRTLHSVDSGDKNRSAGKIAPDGRCRKLLDAVINVVTT